MILCPYKELKRYEASIPGLAEAMELIENLKTFEPATYPLSNGNRILVQQGNTKPAESALAEAHRRYLDIQYVVEGSEVMGWAPLDEMTPAGDFNDEKDVGKYTGTFQFVNVPAGTCYVVYPEDGHMPGVHLENPSNYTKIVVKLKV